MNRDVGGVRLRQKQSNGRTGLSRPGTNHVSSCSKQVCSSMHGRGLEKRTAGEGARRCDAGGANPVNPDCVWSVVTGVVGLPMGV